MNHINFKPYLLKASEIYVSGIVFHSDSGVEDTAKEANIQFETKKYSRKGTKYTKYWITLDEEQIQGFIDEEYHTSTIVKGGHVGWTYRLVEMTLEWDNQHCNLVTLIRLGATDPHGTEIVA